MDETTKKHNVECPGCGHQWEHEGEIVEEGEPIQCPDCYEEWEWDLDDEGTLTLLDDEEEDEDEEGFDDDDDDRTEG